VAPEALVPIFRAAQTVGRERRLDPLLIIAMIGIESRFNPFAESVSGAKGLMQVIPGFHLDKVPQGAGEQPFLDPVTNIQVGVQVLEEAIRWRGSLTAGLQHYGGAADDPGMEYANKVYAEKQRLEQAVRRGPDGRA
jgi:soluble lytic murein transglycosylase-like protein